MSSGGDAEHVLRVCFSDKLISNTQRLGMKRPQCVARYKACRGVSRGSSRCCGNRHRRTCRKNEGQAFGRRPHSCTESPFPATRRRHIEAAFTSFCAIAADYCALIGWRFEGDTVDTVHGTWSSSSCVRAWWRRRIQQKSTKLSGL